MDEIQASLDRKCEGLGVNCHPFLVGWYNSSVKHSSFHLPYSHHTLAMLIISTPSTFETLFLPYLNSSTFTASQLDPLDSCFRHFVSQLVSTFPGMAVEAIQDFEVDPVSKRPLLLVQTAGHVAGVAHYYQREDVNPDPWPKEKRMYGVSMHSNYGGWFAFRGVLIFKEVEIPHLTQRAPPDCVPSQDMRVQLLEKYNFNWQDWSFRDVVVGGAKERYSDQQQLYFSTEPIHRQSLITTFQAKSMCVPHHTN